MATKDALLTLLVISIMTLCIGLAMDKVSLTGYTAAENFTVDMNVTEELPNELANVTGEEIPVIIVFEEQRDIPAAIEEAETAAEEEIAIVENETIVENPIDIKYEFEAMPAVAATVTPEQLQALEDNPDVEVYEDEGAFQISLSQSVPFINATQVWPIQLSGVNITGNGETVCIVDTGINASHPAFAGRVIAQADFCADNTNCLTNDTEAEDLNGHGTHVAGIAASADSTYRGVAPGASLAIGKAANSGGTLYISTITAAIEWCVANKDIYDISVISMSFGDGGQYTSGTCPDSSYPTIDAALDAASDAGIIVFVASGNSGYANGINYPACNSNVVAVGSVDRNADTIQSYSNSGSNLDLLAPGGSSGGQITSTSKDGISFVSKYGTSMATPHVAGVAALILQYNKLKNGKTLTPEELESRLKSTGVKITDSRNNITTARIDAAAAIAPIVTIQSPLNTSYPIGDVDFNITVDNNITSAFVTVDGNETYALSSYSASEWYNTTVSSLSPGEHNATFLATSDINATKIVFFSIDAIPPTIILESPANGSNINAGDILNFTITDNGAVGVVLVGHNNTNTTLASPYDYSTVGWTKGTQNITVYANDTAGNSNSSYFEFNISNSAPVFQSGLPNSTYTILITRPLSITAKAIDPDGEPVSYAISTNITSNYTTHSSNNATIFNWTSNSSETGSYYVQFNATDGIATATAISMITVQNNTAPSMFSISNQTATAGTEKTIYFYASDADLDYGDSLSWSDNTTIFSVLKINSTAAKAKFTPDSDEEGTYNVKITVADLIGATSYKTFTLTVKANATEEANLEAGLLDEGTVIYDNEKTFAYITANTPVSFNPNVAGLGIDNIILETSKEAFNIIMKIRALSSASINARGSVLDYFELVADGLSNSDIKGITIQFSVPRSWLTQNGFSSSDVYLGQLSGYSWAELPATITSEDSATVRYSATTRHLSTFAIAANKQTTTVPIFQTTQTSNVTSAVETTPEERKATVQFTSVLIVFVLVIFIAVLMKRKPELFRLAILKQAKQTKKTKANRTKDVPDFGF